MKKLADVIQALVAFNSFRTPQTRPGWEPRHAPSTLTNFVMPKKSLKRKLAR